MTEVTTIPATILQTSKIPDVPDGPIPVKEKNKNLALYIQPKLTVGAPDDPCEKEADAIAGKVICMPEQNFIRRKCSLFGEERNIYFFYKRNFKT